VKLLLAEDIKNLGKAGEIVEVTSGYARNYLVPQGLGLVPTEGNIKRVEELGKQREADRQAHRQRLAGAVTALEGTSVTVKAQANEQGHLFGSVTQRDIAAALQEMGHKIGGSGKTRSCWPSRFGFWAVSRSRCGWPRGPRPTSTCGSFQRKRRGTAQGRALRLRRYCRCRGYGVCSHVRQFAPPWSQTP